MVKVNTCIILCFFFSIDATENNGRLGRLVNDGDGVNEPVNCVMRVLSGSFASSPRICLFALKDIEPGEELRYDYGNQRLPWRRVSIKSRACVEGVGVGGV